MGEMPCTARLQAPAHELGVDGRDRVAGVNPAQGQVRARAMQLHNFFIEKGLAGCGPTQEGVHFCLDGGGRPQQRQRAQRRPDLEHLRSAAGQGMHSNDKTRQ